jgi:hypothetical protein
LPGSASPPPWTRVFSKKSRKPTVSWRSGDASALHQPAGFRVLDERDLCEFWNTYSEPNGWLYEVEEGGWLELETHRPLFNSPGFHPGLREYLLVDDRCVSVLAVQPPDILDLGADPEQVGA